MMPVSTNENGRKPKILPILITIVVLMSFIAFDYIYEQYQIIKYWELKRSFNLKAAYEVLGEYAFIFSPIDSSSLVREKQDLLVELLLLITIIFAASIYLYRIYIRYSQAQMDHSLIDAAVNGVAGVAVADFDFKILKTNREFSRVTGYAENEAAQRHLKALNLSIPNMCFTDLRAHLMEYRSWKGELSGISKHGGIYTLLARIQLISAARYSKSNIVISFTDISKRKRLETRLRNQSESDPLTGVWNRRKFDAELERLSELTKRYQKPSACIGILDIDYFKRINDQFGHDKGDGVLKKLANFLKNECRSTDIVARIGGEEFAIVMPHTTITEGYATMERLRNRIERKLDFDFTVSGGVALVQHHAAVAFKQADVALYAAKNSGRNQIQRSDPFSA